ncbi:MAG: SDR family NAD(P)-dependent oxidoreductase [Proteobacteria bacterium]|nr:SDR family NAD(P)-dependent oxidoreductase [Pseudomonadota bacterium]
MIFQGKTVIVTGATSGIGAATASAFAGEGARLMLTGRNAERAELTRKKAEAAGVGAATLIGDIRDPDFCERLVVATTERFGRLDILVNNAGVIHCETVDETTDDQWRETMAVNLDAVFFMSRAVLRRMKPQGEGIIINVASDAGVVGVPKMAAYCASKGAVVLLTKAMALDHARDGIRINAVCPNVIDTPMLDDVFRQNDMEAEAGRRVFASENPLDMVAAPKDVADAIIYLASDKARFITGTAFMIDGGFTAG